MKNISKKDEAKEKALLHFLCRTKQGKYAKIDEDSLAFARVKEEREENETLTETFYYNVS
ncbi:hypothetical protein KAR34_03190 [bacterium]|nr:hypothetical protein [bacterium]